MKDRGKGRRVDKAGRDLIKRMLVAGQATSEVVTALSTEGYAPLSRDHIQRYYGHLADVVQGRERARLGAIEQGVADRSQRVETLWNRAKWIDKSIAEMSVSEVSPAVLKTLLTEFREYAKQVAQELGEWQERKDVTSGGRPLAFNLSVLSTEEVVVLEQLRSKLELG